MSEKRIPIFVEAKNAGIAAQWCLYNSDEEKTFYVVIVTNKEETK